MRIRDWDRNLKIRLIGEFFVGATFWMFFPFMTLYFSESLGKSLTGLLLVISQALSVVTNLFGGYCADRFGRKKMMVFASYAQAIISIFFALACYPKFESPILAFVFFALLGALGSFYYPASQAMVADVVPENERTSVFAVFYTTNNLNVVIGPIIGSLFIDNYRFELILADAIVLGLLGFVIQKWISETAPALQPGAETIVNTNNHWYDVAVEQVKSYTIIVKDKIFFLFIFAGVLLSQTYMQLDLLIPVYVKEVVKKSISVSWLPNIDYTIGGIHLYVPPTIEFSANNVFGAIVAENGLIVILFTLVTTRIVKRFSEKFIFMWSALLYAISMVYIAFTTGYLGFFVAMFIFTIAEIMTAGVQMDFIARIAPEDLRGQYYAASGLRWTVGRLLAPISIMGSQLLGFRFTFLSISILAVFSAWLYFYLFTKADQLYPKQTSNV
ncbi:MAG: transporter [Bacillales bacterium]|jgi:MFS family permease|nr:transporter [Bacillales bacterium]